MRVPVRIPEVGASGNRLSVSAWFVEPGEVVDAGDRLLEVLLSGVTCEIVSPCAGQLVRIERDLDAAVAEGDIVAHIEAVEPG